jgi:MFS family permease
MVIMTVVLGPIVSQAADYWGRRPFLIGLTALGAVGCIIVSRANSMGMAIAGFTVTGFSYGAQPLLHAVASEVLPRRYRSWAQAADLVASGLGGITALLVGGALNRQSNPMSESFRTFWYMTTGIFVLATILTVFFYNPPPRETQASLSFSEKLGRLDWVGYALLTGGLVLFCIGLSWSDNPYPWSDPHTSATFAVGMALVLALCLYEAFVKKDGMFHHGLFAERNFAIALACVFCEGVAFFAANQYFAFEVGVLYEQDNLRVGIRYSIPLIVSIFSALGGGLYCAVTKRVRWVTVVAFSVFTGFFIGMATSGPTDSTKVWGFTILLGTGLGLSLCVLITVAQLSTPPELIAIASGILISVRSLGGAVGLAVCEFAPPPRLHVTIDTWGISTNVPVT